MHKVLFVPVIALLFIALSCSTTDETTSNDDIGTADTVENNDQQNKPEGDSAQQEGTQPDTAGNPDNSGTDSEQPDNANDPWLKEDADGDGIPNGIEGKGDLDGDSLPDYLDTDCDNDGISDAEEAGADPQNPVDTDKDTIPDFIDKDSDNDGLLDKAEMEKGTNPLKKDTDGDGNDDLAEIVYGSNPTDDSSNIPESLFFVVLPYMAPDDVQRTLDFTTNINRVDVAILIDVSGSMGEEINNLKQGIKEKIIQGVRAKVEDSGFGLVHFQDWVDDPTKVVWNDQVISTDVDKVSASVDSLPAPYGGTEPHSETLYQTATGEGLHAQIVEPMGAGSTNIDIPKADCSTAEGKIGGLCFREKAMPIFIMVTDEAWEEIGVGIGVGKWNTKPPYQMGHYIQDAIKAMNTIHAKFIGVDTGGSGSTTCKTDFEKVSEGTGSVDKNGNYFNFTMNSDGTGMSEKIAESIADMTAAIQMDVNTAAESTEKCNEKSVADFVIGSIPVAANPANGFKSKDDKTFFDVEPGTEVSFDVHFKNNFCTNSTGKPVIYKAEIKVLGEGAFLSSREVNIVIPESAQE